MSKLTIVLCAVLFASANALSWEDSLKTVQLNVEHVINTAILKGEEQFISNQLETITVAADLSDVTGKFGEKIWEDITRITVNVTTEINKLTAKVEDVSIEDCLKISNQLSEVTKAAIASTSTCINYKLTSGLQYIDTINKVSHDVIADLNDLKEKSQHCADRIDGPKSVADAIACSKAAATEATWVTLKAAPKLTAAWTKLKFLLVTLPRYLANCDANKPLVTFYEESSTAVERTDKCIQQKIQETRNGAHVPFIPESLEDTNLPDSPEFWIVPK